MNQEQLLISFKDAAKMLSVSRALLYSMHSDGRLGPVPYKIGRRSLFKRAEIVEWVNAGLPPRSQWINQQNEKGKE